MTPRTETRTPRKNRKSKLLPAAVAAPTPNASTPPAGLKTPVKTPVKKVKASMFASSTSSATKKPKKSKKSLKTRAPTPARPKSTTAPLSPTPQKTPSSAPVEVGSPPIVLNSAMTPGKLKLLNSSPMRDILSAGERRAAAAQVAEKTEDDEGLQVASGGVGKKRKRGMKELFPKKVDAPSVESTPKVVIEGALSSRKGKKGKRVSFADGVGKNTESAQTPSRRVLSAKSAQVDIGRDFNDDKTADGEKVDSAAMRSMVEAITKDSDDSDGDDSLDFLNSADKGRGKAGKAGKEADGVSGGHLNWKKFRKEKPASERRFLRASASKVSQPEQEEKRKTDETDSGIGVVSDDGDNQQASTGGRKDSRKTKSDRRKDGKRRSHMDREEVEDEVEGGVMFIGRVPHGFYEEQMKGYFSQFGKVLHVRVLRSKDTGGSRGSAFVKFEDPDVAVIAAEAMDGYLLRGKRMITKVVSPENVHPHLFSHRAKPIYRGASSLNARHRMIMRSRDHTKVAQRSKNIVKAVAQRRRHLDHLNIVYKHPTLPSIAVPQAQGTKPSTPRKSSL